MSHGPTFYSSRGYCIYCRAEGVRLTDEHIVPYSLGGNHVLRDASCDHCAKITSKVELKIARELWGQARQSFGATSRRKKRKGKTQIVPDGENIGRFQAVPNEEVPAIFAFYHMPPAGILLGLNETFDTLPFWKMSAIADSNRQEQFERKYGFKPAVGFRHQPKEFGQLLLKIGYGQALTHLDCQDFEAICIPYILGEKSNVSWLVGTNMGESEALLDIGYSLGTKAFGTTELLYIISDIKLWANTFMPWYHAVVGRVQGRDKVRFVVEKLNSINASTTINSPEPTRLRNRI
ncbi:HNH endonuclease [Rhizobium hainanense]|uniref:HNH endonuclease n=1 Tax=Rhizobium hainanense TaxID=52131 RepID=A0A1C3UC91_9HYPH|nr:HNH endonuclease [Rhizobium hainanense]